MPSLANRKQKCTGRIDAKYRADLFFGHNVAFVKAADRKVKRHELIQQKGYPNEKIVFPV
jgi:hypothetical protein